MKSIHISNRLLKIALSSVAFLILIVSALIVINYVDFSNRKGTQPEATDDSVAIYIDGTPYVPKSDIETIMFMGTDKYDSEKFEDSAFRNNMQNDFNLLLILDNDSKKIIPVLINRDTMTDIQTYSISGNKSGVVYRQLALAHTYGTGSSDSCINVTNAVSNLLYDINIDHYFAVSLDAISVLNDAVGGVTLTLLDDFTSVDASMLKGEEIRLKGSQAEYYIRSRYGLEDSTNINRMQRQKQYITEWVKQAKQCAEKNPSFAQDTIIKISDFMTTDMSVSALSKLSEKLSEYEQEAIIELNGESSVVDGYVQFKPDDLEIKKLVIENFYTQLR